MIKTIPKTGVLALAVLLGGGAAIGSPFSLLHSFSGPLGANPNAALVLDASGTLYGTALLGGGSSNCQGGCGSIFSIKSDGTGFTLLHSLMGPDAFSPVAGLVLDANGNLYGTAAGKATANCTSGCGAVFKLKTDGTQFTILHAFSSSSSDGNAPEGGLILDANGVLYGTTLYGGASGKGTVFKISTSGTGFAILHSFSESGHDGLYPYSSLVLDSGGILYGTASQGGGSSDCPSGCGTVFKLGTNGTGFTLLHEFSGADGNGPYGGLTSGEGGILYGTASGGSGHGCEGGCGTVFSLKTDGTGFTVLHAFSGSGNDGLFPYAGLFLDENGSLYGTTEYGGASGAGTVYKIRADGQGYRILRAFSISDGDNPYAGLILDSSAYLYGTTVLGGASGGDGTIFKLSTLDRADAVAIAVPPLAVVNGR
jgi:uncharacterized repeat protein (TIGR03803 family)